MIVYGMNRWKSAKASAFTTGEGSGQVCTQDGGDGGGPIKKPEEAQMAAANDQSGSSCSDAPGGQTPEGETAAAATGLSGLMRPKGGDDAGQPIKKRRLRARGSQRLQAVRSDENPSPDRHDRNHERRASQPVRRRRRRRRTTRSSARPSST